MDVGPPNNTSTDDHRALEDTTWKVTAAERLERWRNGSLPLPNCWAAFDMRPDGSTESQGQVSLTITARSLRNGALSAGLVNLLADTVLGMSSGLGSAMVGPMVTATLNVETIASHLPATGELRGFGTPLSIRGNEVHAAGEILDGVGAPVARISGWFANVPERPIRPAPLVTLSPRTADDIDAMLAHPSVVIEAPGRVRLTVVPEPHMANPHGVLHGGVAAVLADTAAEIAVETATGRRGYLPLSLAGSYLRSVGGDGRAVSIVANVRKPGRRVTTVEVEILASDGRAAVLYLINAATDPASPST